MHGSPASNGAARRRDRRDALLVELRDAGAATAILESDLAAARQALAEAQQAVAAAVCAALDGHAEALATEMLRHQQAAFHIRRRLAVLRDFVVDDRRYTLPATVAAALDADLQPWMQVPMDERPKPREAWAATVAALLQSADAPLGGANHDAKKTARWRSKPK